MVFGNESDKRWMIVEPKKSGGIKNKNGHVFKACRKTGLKGFFGRRHGLWRCLHLLFIAGIQMDADSDHGRHERIMLFCMNEHMMQAVIIEDAVVDTFRGGALFIDFLISISTTGEICPYLPHRNCV